LVRSTTDLIIIPILSCQFLDIFYHSSREQRYDVVTSMRSGESSSNERQAYIYRYRGVKMKACRVWSNKCSLLCQNWSSEVCQAVSVWRCKRRIPVGAIRSTLQDVAPSR